MLRVEGGCLVHVVQTTRLFPSAAFVCVSENVQSNITYTSNLKPVNDVHGDCVVCANVRSTVTLLYAMYIYIYKVKRRYLVHI